MNAALANSSAAPTLPASATKPLWAAVSVLGICLLAMGATLVHVNNRPEPLAQASLPFTSAQAMTAQAALTSSASPVGMVTEEKMIEKPASAGTKPAQSAPKTVVRPTASSTAKAPAATSNPAPATAPVVVAQAPASANEPAPVVVQAPPKPVCASCGTVEAVTPITRDGQGSGVGAIAGGVLGGVVGNQVGKGSGRTVATVLGAIGGGVAGNTIEKKMKKETAYSVRVRMDDGSTRTLEQSSAPAVGSKVTLDGNTLR